MNLLWTIFDYDGAKTADKYTVYGYIPTQPFWTRRHTMAMTLNDAVGRFIEKLNLPPQVDPAFLDFLKDLIQEFLPLLLDICNETPESAPEACQQMKRGGGSPWRRWRGKNKVRRRTKGMPDAYGVTSRQLFDAMLDMGADASPDEIEAVYEQC